MTGRAGAWLRAPRPRPRSSSARIHRIGPLELRPGPTGAEALELGFDDLAGDPVILIVDGSAAQWDALSDVGDSQLDLVVRSLSWLPALTVAVVRGAPPAIDRLVRAFDLRAAVGTDARYGASINAVGDEGEVMATVQSWIKGAQASPEAAVVGAMLARRSVVGSVDDALWRESMAYSLL